MWNAGFLVAVAVAVAVAARTSKFVRAWIPLPGV